MGMVKSTFAQWCTIIGIMGYQELNLGRDLDEIAMAMNRRPLREQIADAAKRILAKIGVVKETISTEEVVKIDLSERI